MDAMVSISRGRLLAADGTVDFSALGPELGRALGVWLVHRRWFGGKALTIRDVAVDDSLPLLPRISLLFVRVQYAESAAETYAMPIGLALGEEAQRLLARDKTAIIARLEIEPDGQTAAIYDPTGESAVARRWLELIAGAGDLLGLHGRIVTERLEHFDALAGAAPSALEPRLLGAEQSNSSTAYGDRLILKLFRRSEPGLNPDVEVTRHLTGLGFAHVPPVAGSIEYCRPGEEPVSLAVLQGFVANRGDAWQHTLSRLDEYYHRVALPTTAERVASDAEAIGPFLDEVKLLARRTGELHLALARPTSDPNFQPEPFTPEYQRAFYDSNSRLVRDTFSLLASRQQRLPQPARSLAGEVLDLQGTLMAQFQPWLERPIDGLRTRIHGDYHLGQVLWTGDDFVIVDFEGEPARPMTERRLKQSPLRDVAGMIRSLHYAAFAARMALPAEIGGERAAPWGQLWYLSTSQEFLSAYLEQAERSDFLPQSNDESSWLLGQFLLEKAVYELRYELNNRPDWLPIPLEAVHALASKLTGNAS
jgi:trehalose synthase-fused probable maltokinase